MARHGIFIVKEIDSASSQQLLATYLYMCSTVKSKLRLIESALHVADSHCTAHTVQCGVCSPKLTKIKCIKSDKMPNIIHPRLKMASVLISVIPFRLVLVMVIWQFRQPQQAVLPLLFATVQSSVFVASLLMVLRSPNEVGLHESLNHSNT